MTACEHKVLPEIGRAVVFNTDSTSYHGHPDPLESPPDVTRRSIALYYYTVPEALRIPHTTVWKKRRSEEHTSELQSLMRISYAVFCLKKKKTKTRNNLTITKSHKE